MSVSKDVRNIEEKKRFVN